MPDQNQKLAELEAVVTKLRGEVENLSSIYSKNNFSSVQTFNKDAIFSTRLRVPVFSSAPDVGEIGDLIAVAGKLYICTTAGNVASPATFTMVGTQS